MESNSNHVACLFDLDGTLIDSVRDLCAAVDHAMHEVGYPTQSLESVKTNIGDGLQVLLERCLGQSRSEAPEIYAQAHAAFQHHYEENLSKETIVIPGMRRLVSSLDAPVGVVSNKPERFSRKVLKALDLEQYVKVLIGGDTLDERKPSPAPILTACEVLGVEPNDCAFIGDGIQDMKAARAAGVDPIGVLWGQGTHGELMAAGARVLARDVAALRVLLIRADTDS